MKTNNTAQLQSTSPITGILVGAWLGEAWVVCGWSGMSQNHLANSQLRDHDFRETRMLQRTSCLTLSMLIYANSVKMAAMKLLIGGLGLFFLFKIKENKGSNFSQGTVHNLNMTSQARTVQ